MGHLTRNSISFNFLLLIIFLMLFNKTPCASCPAKCCRNYSVSLTHIDLINLQKNLGSKFTEFIEFDIAVGFDETLAPHILLNLDGLEKHYILRLRRDKKETCLFLGKNNLCTIYDSRPRKCRTYPFVKNSLFIEMKEGSRCPINWNLTKPVIDQFDHDIDLQKKEIEAFRLICKKWNSSSINLRTIESFLTYLFDMFPDTLNYHKNTF